MKNNIKKQVGIVVIGRNEGDRLIACLNSALREAQHIVYVDSGSKDSSVSTAKDLGAIVVELDLSLPFTAARARNTGWRKLIESYADIEYIHFIDGDCEFEQGWLCKGYEFMHGNGSYAVACGQRKERFPTASVYNSLCDIEWNTPVGDAYACGGDALIRVSALQELQGYPEDFIAGEEPELCFRLREKGWKICRLEGIMTWHDAAIMKFSQWWSRTKRCGFAYALGFDRHGKSKELYQKKEVTRIALWGGFAPAVLVVSMVYPILLFLLLVYPIQFLRLVKNSRLAKSKYSWSFFNVIGKFPELIGILEFYWKKLLHKKMEIIEYK